MNTSTCHTALTKTTPPKLDKIDYTDTCIIYEFGREIDSIKTKYDSFVTLIYLVGVVVFEGVFKGRSHKCKATLLAKSGHS